MVALLRRLIISPFPPPEKIEISPQSWMIVRGYPVRAFQFAGIRWNITRLVVRSAPVTATANISTILGIFHLYAMYLTGNSYGHISIVNFLLKDCPH